MAERPDYEKGIALLSAPAEDLLWVDGDSFAPLGNGVPGPTSEAVTIYAPAGYIAEAVAFEFYVGEPNVWAAGDYHRWRLSVNSGTFYVCEDRHVQGSTPPEMGWDFSTAMQNYLAGSSVGYPFPDTADRQWARLPLLVCTPTDGLQLFYWVSLGATLEQYAARYWDVLLRVKAVS